VDRRSSINHRSYPALPIYCQFPPSDLELCSLLRFAAVHPHAASGSPGVR